MVLGIDFLKDFDAFWVAKRSQVGSKNVPKIVPGEVLGGSWWVLGGSKRPRPKNEMSDPFFGAVLGPSWVRIGAVLGPSWAILGPSWPPRRSQNSKKLDPEENKNVDAAWSRFFPKYAAKHKGFLPSVKNCLLNPSAGAPVFLWFCLVE